MLKAILFFSLFLPSIFCFATDTITPKPITLTFFELTNKLTAQHKKQLDKVAGFLKKNKEYKIAITVGFNENGKIEKIAEKRAVKIMEYFEKKSIKDSVYNYGLSNQVDYHNVAILIYKDVVDSSKTYNLDSLNFITMEFLNYRLAFTKTNKFVLDQISTYLQAHKMAKINLIAGVNSGWLSNYKSDIRIKIITHYLTLNKLIDKNIISSEKSESLNDNLVNIEILK